MTFDSLGDSLKHDSRKQNEATIFSQEFEWAVACGVAHLFPGSALSTRSGLNSALSGMSEADEQAPEDKRGGSISGAGDGRDNRGRPSRGKSWQPASRPWQPAGWPPDERDDEHPWR